MRETIDLEYKQEVGKNKTFLKTVSAFANYGTGQIIFGVTDEGVYKGIVNPRQACLDIENTINDSIDPQPEYTLQIDEQRNIIILTVYKGEDTPYVYKEKAYRRHDSATIPVDRVAFRRLCIEGANTTFDALSSQEQNLEFSILERCCQEEMGISALSEDLLITLDLYDRKDGFTNAGALLADVNQFTGIDIARFGETENIILNRYQYEHESILKQHQEALKIFEQYYEYEEIQGFYRKRIERIPKVAFREAVANALVHRDWDSQRHIQISMYDEYIRIVSPGALPPGLTEKDYLEASISELKNPIVGDVFFRLNLIERYGTGIQRIIRSYHTSKSKPSFTITANSIEIILPVLRQSLEGVSETALEIYDWITKGYSTTKTLVEITTYSKSKVLKHIRELLKEKYIEQVGQGRAVQYKIRE